VICLGIESTAHTFGVGICKGKTILSDKRAVYKPPLGSGIHPKKAAQHHAAMALQTIEGALSSAHLKLKDIDLIAFSQGPGLPPCLQVGLIAAKSLAEKGKKPLIGVNHCLAHVEIGKLITGAHDPIVVYVSGGNTQILGYTDGRYRVFGETEDIALGNALDSFARKIGLPHPGGPVIEKMAKSGKKYIKLPYVVKGMDLSFSGIVTAAVREYSQKGQLVSNLCFSIQETCFAMLTEVTERALAHTGKKEVLVTGGVAASGRLKQMLRIMCKERGAKLYFVPKKYSGDNGVMIALTGLLVYKHGIKPLKGTIKIKQKWRIDE